MTQRPKDVLLPCPMDGCKASHIGTGNNMIKSHNKYAVLAECGLMTKWFDSVEESSMAWNKRIKI